VRRSGIQRRLLLVVAAAVAGAVAALVVAFNILVGHTLSRSANDLLRGRVAAELAALHPDHGRLTIAEAPDAATGDTAMWVFARGRTLEQPRVAGPVDAAARALAGGPRRFLDVDASDVRFYAVPVVFGGRRLGTVVAASSLAPYEETRNIALVGSLVFGGFVLLVVVFAARWLLSSSLRPVARMTVQAATWSERDLDQRFGLGEPHDELTQLAATLDGLLDRLSASLRREQRFSAELSHELRTPLSRVLAEAGLALRRERSPDEYRQALGLVHRNAEQLTRIVDALVGAARHEAGSGRGTADAFTVAAEAAAACESLAAERRLEIQVEQPARVVRIGVDAELAARILQPILENACRYGRARVRVSIDRDAGGVRYAVDDDGPGVAKDELERIFEPGARGRLGEANGDGGAGLGLSLARRLARSVTGEVEALADGEGGRFLVHLPAG
jgi:two-component system, OmpR family, sensor kinase